MIVYKTTNLVTGKFYVGLDKKNNPEYLGSGLLLRKAIKKYGRENFKKEILETCKTIEELQEREQFWIKELNSQNREIGYNVADGGSGGDTFTNNPEKEEIRKKFKRHHTEETKRKISEHNWQKKISGENHPLWGKSQTFETKEKRKQTFLKKGKFAHSGKTHTFETKDRIRTKKLGVKQSAETVEKRRASLIGKKQKTIECPYCKKQGGIPSMQRWHFNNCKQRCIE